MRAARLKRIATHAALLVAPVAMLGRYAAFVRPQGIACVLAMLLVAELEAGAAAAPDTSRLRAPGAGLALVSALGLLVTTWAAIAGPWSSISPSPAWTWLGLPLVALGAALRVAAIRALGAAFTSEIVARPGHALVTRGVYEHLRHPSDAGLLLLAVGLSVLGASPLALLAVALVVAPSVVARVRREERVLAAHHGMAHATYVARVGLMPRSAAHSRTSVPNASGT